MLPYVSPYADPASRYPCVNLGMNESEERSDGGSHPQRVLDRMEQVTRPPYSWKQRVARSCCSCADERCLHFLVCCEVSMYIMSVVLTPSISHFREESIVTDKSTLVPSWLCFLHCSLQHPRPHRIGSRACDHEAEYLAALRQQQGFIRWLARLRKKEHSDESTDRLLLTRLQILNALGTTSTGNDVAPVVTYLFSKTHAASSLPLFVKHTPLSKPLSWCGAR